MLVKIKTSKIRYYLLLFLAGIFLSSCFYQSDLKQVQGYWREYDKTHSDFYNSFFILDSIVSYKEYLKTRSRKLKLDQTKLSLPKNIYEWTNKYKVYKNKIIFEDSTVWVKSTETIQTKIEDLYSNLKIKVIPPIVDTDSLDLFSTIDNSYIVDIINIGQKKKSFNDSLLLENYSTVQLNHVFAQFKQISIYLERSCGTSPYKGSVLIINADSRTPTSFIDSVAEIGARNYYRKNIFLTVLDTSNNDVIIKLIKHKKTL